MKAEQQRYKYYVRAMKNKEGYHVTKSLQGAIDHVHFLQHSGKENIPFQIWEITGKDEAGRCLEVLRLTLGRVLIPHCLRFLVRDQYGRILARFEYFDDALSHLADTKIDIKNLDLIDRRTDQKINFFPELGWRTQPELGII